MKVTVGGAIAYVIWLIIFVMMVGFIINNILAIPFW